MREKKVGQERKKIGQESRSRVGKIIVRTYWRDNSNPFPGKRTETKIVKIPRAALRFTEAESRVESKTSREIKTAAEIAEWFEAFVDSALEGGYQ